MQTVQREADKRARKIQLSFTQFFITNKRKQPTKEKGGGKHKTQKVEKVQPCTKTQLTLNRVARNGKRKIIIGKQLIMKKTKLKYKRWRGKRWSYCMTCNQGGNLIECHTCIHVSHAECSNNMPINFADRRVVWRCTACEEEDGKTQCPYSKFKATYKRKIVNDKNKQDKIYNDKRKGKTTGGVEDVPEYVTKFIESDLRGRIVTTHPDGHCVRRAIGKIWNLHPGQVIQYLATKCQKMLDQEITTQWERNVEWYEKTANRPNEWRELKNNVPKTCKRDEWGGSSEIHIWAIITKTIMVEINVDNETALIHYPDSNKTTGLNLRTQMQALKDIQATTHAKKILNI